MTSVRDTLQTMGVEMHAAYQGETAAGIYRQAGLDDVSVTGLVLGPVRTVQQDTTRGRHQSSERSCTIPADTTRSGGGVAEPTTLGQVVLPGDDVWDIVAIEHRSVSASRVTLRQTGSESRHSAAYRRSQLQ